MELFPLALALAYQGASLCGILALLSYWASGRPRATGAFFMLFALAVPTAAWGLTFFVPWASLALPASLALFYYRTKGDEREETRGVQSVADEELAAAEREIARDPKNAAAVFAKAQALEKRGSHELALAYYEEAHALSERMFTQSELEQTRERLADAKAAALREPAPPALGERLETAGLALGVLIGLGNWLMGLNLVALMLFLRWFRRASI